VLCAAFSYWQQNSHHKVKNTFFFELLELKASTLFTTSDGDEYGGLSCFDGSKVIAVVYIHLAQIRKISLRANCIHVGGSKQNKVSKERIGSVLSQAVLHRNGRHRSGGKKPSAPNGITTTACREPR